MEKNNKKLIFPIVIIVISFLSLICSMIPWVLIGGIIAVADGAMPTSLSYTIYLIMPSIGFVAGVIALIISIIKIKKYKITLISLIISIISVVASFPWVGFLIYALIDSINLYM